MVLAIKNMGGESAAAWRAMLDDLTSRGLGRPELVIVDGGKGLEAALASLWDDVPVQRCTVLKERNLLAHAPQHLHDEIKADFNDMVHAGSALEVVAKRKTFLGKWKLRCRAVADSLEEAGERLFTFLRYPPEQWRSLRTTNAIERLHEEFSAGSRPSASYPAPTRRPCCSGRCSRQVRSPCGGSTVGRPWSAHPPTLTSSPDPTHHAISEPAPPNFHQLRDTTLEASSDRSRRPVRRGSAQGSLQKSVR